MKSIENKKKRCLCDSCKKDCKDKFVVLCSDYEEEKQKKDIGGEKKMEIELEKFAYCPFCYRVVEIIAGGKLPICECMSTKQSLCQMELAPMELVDFQTTVLLNLLLKCKNKTL